ncbi:MAG: hypothetical protein HYZ14_07380 [Bacteroidetes bacterium]|nr:hypothetical protein [Bacteroidota bacterium]
MPVEIRELIIKTEISSGGKNASGGIKPSEINALKKQLLEECRRIILEKTKKNSYKR